MKPLLIALMTAVMLSCAPLSSPPPPSGVEADDSRIAADIAILFHDAGLPGRERVRILVEDGVVVLEGRLASRDDVETAVELARRVSGVVSVDERLEVPESGS